MTAHAARSVSFQWNANPDAVDGYRIYYKTSTGGPPYNGTGLIESSSPVQLGNVTSFTLHGLADTETYYFTLTAYRGTLESSYTKEIILKPVVAANTLPSAVGASFSTTKNTKFSARLSATDPNNDPLTYRIIRNPGLGTVVLTSSSTGAFTYSPSSGAVGSDSFTFRVNDGTGDSNTATVNILITQLNTPPVAVISSSAGIGAAPLQVQFNGTGSRDSDGTVSGYAWDFGDGKTATGAFVSHSYGAAGTYTARLTVTDNSGGSGTATTPIVVTAVTAGGNVPPNPVISVSTARGAIPLSVTFNASGSSDPDGRIISYRWDFNDGTIAYGSSVSHVFRVGGVYPVILRVKDDKGAFSTAARTITALDAATVKEKKKFPWDLFHQIININNARRKNLVQGN